MSNQINLNKIDSNRIDNSDQLPGNVAQDKIIQVADFRVTGDEHLMINAAILEGLVKNNWKVMFAATESHIKAMKNCVDLSSIETQNMPESYFENRFKTFINRELLFIAKLIRLQINAKRKGATEILITSISPLGHILIRLLDLIQGVKRCKIVMHAELEQLNPEKPITISKAAMHIWRLLQNRTQTKIEYICLSQHIQLELESIGLKTTNFKFSLHPFPSKYVNQKPKTNTPSKKITIVVPGLIRSDTKSIHEVFNLEKLLIDEINSEEVEIRLVGRLHRSALIPTNTRIKVPFANAKRPIQQQEFDTELSRADYILLPYKNNAYKMTASGAIFDSLKYSAPALSYPNQLFCHLNEVDCFPGRIFSTTTEMAEHIKNQLNNLNNKEVKEAKTQEMEAKLRNLIIASNPSIFIKRLYP